MWKGITIGVLLSALAFGIYTRWQQIAPQRERTPAALSNVQPLAPEVRSWHRISVRTDAVSFRFKGQAAMPVYGSTDSGSREVLSGRFVSSQSFVHAVILSADDAARFQKGFPPLDVQLAIEPGKPFSIVLKPGLQALVFFQTPPQPDLGQAKSMAGLLALSMQGLIGAPEAAITRDFTFEYQVFETDEEARQALLRQKHLDDAIKAAIDSRRPLNGHQAEWDAKEAASKQAGQTQSDCFDMSQPGPPKHVPCKPGSQILHKIEVPPLMQQEVQPRFVPAN